MEEESSYSSSTDEVIDFFEFIFTEKERDYLSEIHPTFLASNFECYGLTSSKWFKFIRNCIREKKFFYSSIEDKETEFVKRARRLYALIHQRYICTPEGLLETIEKFNSGCYGRCPRYECHNGCLLPFGPEDQYGKENIQLWCPNCHNLYQAPVSLDGAFFGPTYAHLFEQSILRERAPVINY